MFIRNNVSDNQNCLELELEKYMTLNSQLIRDNELKKIQLESFENQLKRGTNSIFLKNNYYDNNSKNYNNNINFGGDENYNEESIDSPVFKEEFDNKLYQYCNFAEKNNNNNLNSKLTSNNNNNINNVNNISSSQKSTLIPSFQDINNAVFAYNPKSSNSNNNNINNFKQDSLDVKNAVSDYERDRSERSYCSNVFNSNLKNIDLLKARVVRK